MSPHDPALPVVFDRRTAIDEGLSRRQVSRRTQGAWGRLHRGQYTAAALDERGHWQAQVLAVLRAQARELVLSHACAARAWRLPEPLGGWGTPTFTCTTGGSRRATTHAVHVAPLPGADVVVLGRVAVTSVARTVVDCARRLPGRDALAIADRALRLGVVTREELATAVARQKGWPGAGQARRIVELTDARRETPLESWSAWAFAELGLVTPRWQVTITDALGVFLGRVDAWWPRGVAGEADGRLKYRLGAAQRGGATGDALAAVVHEERLREMALRRVGVCVVRWHARDVLQPGRAEALVAHVRRELAAAGAFVGSAVQP